jgi:hypothetical protein
MDTQADDTSSCLLQHGRRHGAREPVTADRVLLTGRPVVGSPGPFPRIYSSR